jgi:hypothetical protein
MSADLPRWVFAAVLILCVLGMLLWARGTTHHRGEIEGAWGPSITVSWESGR